MPKSLCRSFFRCYRGGKRPEESPKFEDNQNEQRSSPKGIESSVTLPNCIPLSRFEPPPPLLWKEKALKERPSFGVEEAIVTGDVFVHGSGDCDQLGLGEGVLERQKPTLLKSLRTAQIVSVACGGMHTICVSATGSLYSWGCDDDGALGRPSGQVASEPGVVALPLGTVALVAFCGDCHSCALDNCGKVWGWGSYKDCSGYIGLARGGGTVVQKSCEPELVGLHHVIMLASGANHTVALDSSGHVYSWGSNESGQLGLNTTSGCDFALEEVPGLLAGTFDFVDRVGGGVLATTTPDAPAVRVLRIRKQNGEELEAYGMVAAQVNAHIREGIASLVLEITNRVAPLEEKQLLLFPQRLVTNNITSGSIKGAFASSECSFLTTAGEIAYGCGLNSNGQAGAGYASAGVLAMTAIHDLRNATWVGGGVQMSAALVGQRVYTWGKAVECGQGLASDSPPLLRPRLVALPSIRVLRCGMCHTLACSEAGDVFVWGCGISHQLGNRPRSCADPYDAREEPTDELLPYQLSSKQLDDRFVLLADGGAQHTVELAWVGNAITSSGEVVDEEAQWASEVERKAEVYLMSLENDTASSDVETIKVESRLDFWRVQVESVYRRRNPYKLKDVPTLLQKYEGKEAILYVKVCKTYDLDPSKFYADPRAWADEETDVKDDNETSTTQGNVDDVVNPPSLFPNNFSISAMPVAKASGPPSLFVFGEKTGEDAESTDGSEEDPDQPRGRDARKGKVKRDKKFTKHKKGR